MKEPQFRTLTDSERNILAKLLYAEFEGRDAIKHQVDRCLVRAIDVYGSLEFSVQTDVRAQVKRRIPIEGQFVDVDGTQIHVLLHVVNQKIAELEFYKDDSSLIVSMPPVEKLEVILLP